MSVKKWKTLSSQEILKHPRMHLIEDEVQLPDGRTAHYLRFAPSTSHSVTVIAINEGGEVLLQQEYSYPPDEVLWQLPGGSIEKDEDIIEAAKRELSEESGFTAQDATLLGYFYTNNRRSDQKQYVVVCRNLQSHQAESDPEEFIESTWVSVDSIKQMIRAGEFRNINLLAALNMWFMADE